MRRIYDAEVEVLHNAVDPWSSARIRAYSTAGAGRHYHAVPSRTLDKHMTDAEVSVNLSLLSGVDVLDANYAFRFCGILMDTKGSHYLSCTAGGDVLMRHNDVRDILYKSARRGNLQPTLEKAGPTIPLLPFIYTRFPRKDRFF